MANVSTTGVHNEEHAGAGEGSKLGIKDPLLLLPLPPPPAGGSGTHSVCCAAVGAPSTAHPSLHPTTRPPATGAATAEGLERRSVAEVRRC